MQPSPDLIHPTAVISPQAELAADVTVGAFAVLEGQVRLGAGCVVGPRAHLMGPLTMGRDNRLYTSAAIGGSPQHLRYQDEPTGVEVGDGNTFRENVTVHRATAPSGRTLIGSGNYFMAGSHVGHDCQVGDHCTLAANALLGGHCALAEGAYVGDNSAVHQFCRLRRLAVLEATSSATVDIAPFIVQRERNVVVGVNAAGMRRAGLGEGQIRALQRCFDTVYLRGLLLTNALDQLEGELGAVDVVREFVAFARQSRRGIARVRDRGSDAAT